MSHSSSPATTPAQPPAALFRSAALDRMASPDQLNMAAAIVRPGAWLLLLVGAIVLVSGVLASIFITVPVKVDADGILLSPAGVRDVTAISGGQLRKLDVRVGDHVTVGQTVAELEEPDMRQELDQAKAELRDAQDQLKATQAFNVRTDQSQTAFRAQQKQNLLSSIDFADKRIGWLVERIKGQQDLSEKGFVTKQAVLGSRVELGQAQEELARNRVSLQQLTVDEGNQKIERERESLSLNLKVESAQRHVDMLTSRMARTVAVESPYDGIVAELKVNNGEVAERGTALMTLIPAEIANATEPHGDGNHSVRQGPPIPLVATVYVAPSEGKRVTPGMQVEVLPSTAKREEFGFIVGHVVSVSAVPATQEGMQREIKNRQMVATLAGAGAPFEVRVALEIDVNTPSGFKWSSSQGPNTTLSGGSPCKAEIVTRSETILQMLIPALKRIVSRFV